MHIEMQLVSRIIRSGELAGVIEWGIHEEDFRTTEGRGIFVHLLGYWKALDTSGAIPGPQTFQKRYPNFELCDDLSMTTDALCAEVRRERLITEAREALVEINEMLELDHTAALTHMANRSMMLRSLGMKMNDDPMSNAIENLVYRYDQRALGYSTCLFRWPWDALNAATDGVQDDDYIVFYGRPKSKKSFVLGKFIADVYEQDKCVLVYTKEMPTWQIHRRVVAAIARLPFEEFRLGKLSDAHRRSFLETAETIRLRAKATSGRHNVIAISGKDAPAGQDNMTWLRGKIEKYKPDVVFIDGLYLMAPDRKTGKDNERVMQISRAARQTVLDTKTPIIATMQANRSASKSGDAELDEIAYSDAIGQDATCVIRVINEKTTPDSPSPTVALVVAGSREFHLDGIRIGGMPYTDLEFREELSAKEVQKAKEGDSNDSDKKAEKSAPQPIRSPVSASEHRKLLNSQMKTV